jgi:hypothetical protein
MTDRLISEEGERLYREALQRIDADPESWDQASFGYRRFTLTPAGETECGTVACLAGHIIMAAGGSFAGVATYVMPGGLKESAEPLARRLLGIDMAAANALFEAGNTREDLDIMLKSLVNGERPKVWFE